MSLIGRDSVDAARGNPIERPPLNPLIPFLRFFGWHSQLNLIGGDAQAYSPPLEDFATRNPSGSSQLDGGELVPQAGRKNTFSSRSVCQLPTGRKARLPRFCRLVTQYLPIR